MTVPQHIEPTGLCPHGGEPEPYRLELDPFRRPWKDDGCSLGAGYVYRTTDGSGLALSVEKNEGDCACPAIVCLSLDASAEVLDQWVLAAGTYDACLAEAARLVASSNREAYHEGAIRQAGRFAQRNPHLIDDISDADGGL